MYKTCLGESFSDGTMITFDEYDDGGKREYHVSVASLATLERTEFYVFDFQEDGYKKYAELCEKYRTLPF